MKNKSAESLLVQWQAPSDAGDPVGCLATTFTFDPGFFEEQCLARFLRLDSLPEREGLAYLLERETRLGAVSATVLADRSYAGVDHAMRWDVLPVHISSGVQHAKVCVLAWTELVRIIVSSANLTEQAYRRNREVAVVFDANPRGRDSAIFDDCLDFLSRLTPFVLGADSASPAVERAREFLSGVKATLKGWPFAAASRKGIIASFAGTLPRNGTGEEGLSALDATLQAARKAGNAPASVSVASPFFDDGPAADGTDLIADLSSRMGRSVARKMTLCVPSLTDGGDLPKLGAPRALYDAALARFDHTNVRTLPMWDGDGNARPWHAKLLRLEQADYHAIMTGSSNFTRAGMGVGKVRNAEANIVYVVAKDTAPVTVGKLLEVWPETDAVADPAAAEWIGAYELNGEQNGDMALTDVPSLPLGFITAIFRSGQVSQIELRFNVARLPESWAVYTGDDYSVSLYDHETHHGEGSPAVVILPWRELFAPGALQVRWDERVALWPVNVEDPSALPLPKEFSALTADDILWYLASVRPSHAIAQIARKLSKDAEDDGEAAIAPDLDPLRRYNLAATFLHRVRARARLFTTVRERLSGPVWSEQALLWRLRGPLGASEVLKRLCVELLDEHKPTEETVLTLADFLLMLAEVKYTPKEGYLPKEKFDALYDEFYADALKAASSAVSDAEVSTEISAFWDSVQTRTGAERHV